MPASEFWSVFATDFVKKKCGGKGKGRALEIDLVEKKTLFFLSHCKIPIVDNP